MWDEGWLCRARPYKLETNIDLTHVPVSPRTQDFALSRLAAATNSAKRNQTIVDTWRELVHAAEGRKSTLIFCTDVAHMQALQQAFVKAGVDAHFVHGATSSRTRAQILDEFRERKLPVLINCGVFTEGTDIPCVDCIIMARPTRSSVLFQQMLGRGLRQFPGKPDCLVIDLVDNLGKNSSLTVPSLMGLVPHFDAQGQDIFAVYRDMQAHVAANPRAVFAASMCDAASIAQEQAGARTQQQLRHSQASPTLARAGLVTVKSEKEWASLTDLPFFARADGYQAHCTTLRGPDPCPPPPPTLPSTHPRTHPFAYPRPPPPLLAAPSRGLPAGCWHAPSHTHAHGCVASSSSSTHQVLP